MSSNDGVRVLSTLVAALLIAACDTASEGVPDRKSHGGNEEAWCESIAGGEAQVATTFGSATDNGLAADGDLNTYATLDIGIGRHTVAIRATSQDGIVFAAGSKAGAFWAVLGQGSANITTINTYLDGMLQESSSTNQLAATRGGTDADHYIYFTTSKPFDAVEISETDLADRFPDYHIYEVCSDGHV